MDLRYRLGLVLVALAGLLTGHAASYFVVAPDAHERAALLAVTGHSQHGAFGTIALAAAVAGLIGIVMHRARTRCEVAGPGVSRLRVATLLWAAQTAGFVLLETWERGHGIAGAAELAAEPAFLVGLVAQLVVAVVATALVVLVRATVDALLRLLTRPLDETPSPAFTPTTRVAAPVSVSRAAWNLRGPPSPAGSPS
ncbi:MAG TPA: hypothetical protein VG318_16950 [Actinomycetota bacterium]|nr:hypothetical protein [Actinomycetota bacterium]